MRLTARDAGIDDGDIFICNDPYLGAIHAARFRDRRAGLPRRRAGRLDRRLGPSARHRRHGPRRLLDQGRRRPPGRPADAAGQAGRRRAGARGRAAPGSSTRCATRSSGSTSGPDRRAEQSGRQRVLELIATWGIDAVKSVMRRRSTTPRDEARRAARGAARRRVARDAVHRPRRPRAEDLQDRLHDDEARRPADLRLHRHQPERARPDQLRPMRACRPPCCRRSTSTCAGTFPGIAACATASTSLAEPGTVNNCAVPGAVRDGDDLGGDRDDRRGLALPVAACCWRASSTASRRWPVWSGTSMAPIFAGHEPARLPVRGHRDEPLRRRRRRARPTRDGVDTAGIVFNTTPNMPNIEDQEAEYPVLYLFRRHLRDSGGPGRFRGGRSGELAYTSTTRPAISSRACSPAPAPRCRTRSASPAACRARAIRVARVVETDLRERLERQRRCRTASTRSTGEREILCCQARAHADGARRRLVPQLAGGRRLRRPAAARAGDASPKTSRAARSRAQAASEIYGVGRCTARRRRCRATQPSAATPSAQRGCGAARPAGERRLRAAGDGRHRYGDALRADFDSDVVACGHCGASHCGTRRGPAAAPARGGRTRCRAPAPCAARITTAADSRCASSAARCGGLVDVQVALDGRRAADAVDRIQLTAHQGDHMQLVRFSDKPGARVRARHVDRRSIHDLTHALRRASRSFVEAYPDGWDASSIDLARCAAVRRQRRRARPAGRRRAPTLYLVGANYRKHADRGRPRRAGDAGHLHEAATALVGPASRSALPPISSQMDYEGELAVVIGRHARPRVEGRTRHRCVAGYTIVNDVTARDLQWVMLGKNRIVDWLRRRRSTSRRRSARGIVPARAVGDIRTRLHLTTWLNGELMQDGETSLMVFSVWRADRVSVRRASRCVRATSSRRARRSASADSARSS